MKKNRRAGQPYRLGTFPADSASQLNVLRHDGHSLGVDGTQVGVFEKTHQVCLASLLQGHDSRPLEPEVRLEVLSDLTHKPLERQLADEELSALLVPTDLTESDRPGAVTVRLLDTPGGRGGLASSLGGELLPWGFPSGGLASGLLCTGHGKLCRNEAECGSPSSIYTPWREHLLTY